MARTLLQEAHEDLVRKAVAAERERCAEIAEAHRLALTNGGAINACKFIAAAIRAAN